jgi:hypothetical protein
VIAIYKLIDPDNQETRYVGQTKHPKTRLHGHLCGHLDWVLELKADGKSPIMEIIEWVDLENANDREKFWIEKLKTEGARLLNVQLTMDQSSFKTLKISDDLHYLLRRKAVDVGCTITQLANHWFANALEYKGDYHGKRKF